MCVFECRGRWSEGMRYGMMKERYIKYILESLLEIGKRKSVI